MVVDQDQQLLSLQANFHQESIEICFRFLSPRSCISKVCKWFYCCNNFSAPNSFRSGWYLWNSTSSALFNLKRWPWISAFVCLDSHPFHNFFNSVNVIQHFEIGELHTLSFIVLYLKTLPKGVSCCKFFIKFIEEIFRLASVGPCNHCHPPTARWLCSELLSREGWVKEVCLRCVFWEFTRSLAWRV